MRQVYLLQNIFFFSFFQFNWPTKLLQHNREIVISNFVADLKVVNARLHITQFPIFKNCPLTFLNKI